MNSCRVESGGCRRSASMMSRVSFMRLILVAASFFICDLDLAHLGCRAECAGLGFWSAHAGFLAVRVLAGFGERNCLECRSAQPARALFPSLLHLFSSFLS